MSKVAAPGTGRRWQDEGDGASPDPVRHHRKPSAEGRLLPLLLLGGVFLLGSGCSASPPPSSPRVAKPLRVVTPGDYAPFAICSSSASLSCEGFDVALVRSYAAHRGLRISWSVGTWATLADDIQEHDMAIGGITIREERERVGPFSEPLVRTGKQALLRCADQQKYQTFRAIEIGARIVANLGGGNEKFARAHFPPDAVLILEANNEVPTALRTGDADVFFTDGPEAELLAQNHESLCIGLGGTLHEPFEIALWFAPTSLALRKDFARYLKSPCGRERLRDLRIRYRLPEPKPYGDPLS